MRFPPHGTGRILQSIFAGNRTQVAKNFHEPGYIVRPEAQQVGITRRPMRLVGPEREQHRSLQHETIFEIRSPKAIKQSLERILREHQIEGLVATAGELPEMLAYGSGKITYGLLLHVSDSR